MNKKISKLIASISILIFGTLITLGSTNFKLNDKNIINFNEGKEKVQITRLQAGWRNSSAISSDSNVYTWGRNDLGQIGDGTFKDKAVPEKISFPDLGSNDKITHILTNTYTSVAKDSDGNIYTWGYNKKGQLGNGSKINGNTPEKISFSEMDSNDEIVQVSLGQFHSAALDSAGNVYTWGGDYYGQLGNGQTKNDDVVYPTKINFSEKGANDTIKTIEMGMDYSSALDSAGNVYTWGHNEFGQLGNGTTGTNKNVNAPKKITFSDLDANDTITNMSMGNDHSLALDSDGNVYTWGRNEWGQLGKTTTWTDTNTPGKIKFSQIDKDNTITHISTSNHHSAAVDSAGVVYTWGHNDLGQLGDNTLKNNNSPKKLIFPDLNSNSGETITQVSMGIYDSAALDSSGKVYTWGDNEFGQLGNAIKGKTPVTVPTVIYDPGYEIMSSNVISITPETPTEMTFSVETTTEPTIKTISVNALENGKKVSTSPTKVTTLSGSRSASYKISNIDPNAVYTEISVEYGSKQHGSDTIDLTDEKGREIKSISNGIVTLVTPPQGIGGFGIAAIVFAVLAIIPIPIAIYFLKKEKSTH